MHGTKGPHSTPSTFAKTQPVNLIASSHRLERLDNPSWFQISKKSPLRWDWESAFYSRYWLVPNVCPTWVVSRICHFCKCIGLTLCYVPIYLQILQSRVSQTRLHWFYEPTMNYSPHASYGCHHFFPKKDMMPFCPALFPLFPATGFLAAGLAGLARGFFGLALIAPDLAAACSGLLALTSCPSPLSVWFIC